MTPASTAADVVVVGGGLAGLTAALTVAERGYRPLVIERDDECGGAARLSMGGLWTHVEADRYRAACPQAQGPADVLRRGFEEAVAWASSRDAPILEREGNAFGASTAYQLEVDALIPRWCAQLLDAGGAVWTRTRATDIRPHTTGFHFDLEVEEHPSTVDAACIILATGGIASDPELRARLLGPAGAALCARTHERASGDGLRLGQALGAHPLGAAEGLYGHLLPYPLGTMAATDPLAAQYHSIHGVLLDQRGDRFVDEGLGDHVSNRALAQLPHHRALLVWPIDAGDESGPASTTTARRRMEAAVDAGANAAADSTVAQLVDAASDWGYPREPVHTSLMDAGLRDHRLHGVEVQPSITLADVGLAVNQDCAVLDEGGRPLGGVYAAGADVGGVFGLGYAGGLAAALTLGRRAGQSAEPRHKADSDRTKGPAHGD